MLEPSGPKKPPISKNWIQIQLSKEEFSSNASSFFSTPYLSREDKDKDTEIEESTEQLPTKKRGRLQSSLGKKNQDQKARSTTASIVSDMSSRQHLQ